MWINALPKFELFGIELNCSFCRTYFKALPLVFKLTCDLPFTRKAILFCEMKRQLFHVKFIRIRRGLKTAGKSVQHETLQLSPFMLLQEIWTVEATEWIEAVSGWGKLQKIILLPCHLKVRANGAVPRQPHYEKGANFKEQLTNCTQSNEALTLKPIHNLAILSLEGKSFSVSGHSEPHALGNDLIFCLMVQL